MRERLTILVIVGTRTDEHSLRSQVAVAAPEGRTRVGFSLCEATERRRREERGAEGSRRHRRRGGSVWGGGMPLPIRLGGLGGAL